MPHVVRQEAGPEFDQLGGRLSAIAEVTSPLIETVTGLQLPDPAVIHLMTFNDWKKAHEERSLQRLRDEAAQFGVGAGGKMKAHNRRAVLLAMRFKFWPMMVGEAVDLVPGCPELVIVPEALQHAGLLNDDPVLHKMLAHEGTHLAQYTASGGGIWDEQESFFPQERGVAGRNYAFLLEGHAYWADAHVTTKIFSAPVLNGGTSPDASELWRELASHSAPEEIKAGLLRSTGAVAQLIDAVGLDVFNRVWTEPDLLPTMADGDPEAWRQRFEPGHRPAAPR
ncbi:zinc-dependent metalloprotease [Streptomyces sp. BH-SS-21]|uniref:Zinc-dependent metalloprotease n=1 Tax=Streptomyces liliiviolaceus TaxID=2823109 RepID=A0A941BD57_9ACTN|nr:zinc-dependent metalloprotease [Streptomyces liliiviolaceus]MBQ0855447.1 zinc-dependent metalloprotease [Streptomyces liliiviolaceus]